MHAFGYNKVFPIQTAVNASFQTLFESVGSIDVEFILLI